MKQTEAVAASKRLRARSWSTRHDGLPTDQCLLVDRADALDAAAGQSDPSPGAMRGSARTINAHLMGTTMLQTLIWRRMAPPKVASDAWWRRRALLPPRFSMLVGVLALLCGGFWTVGEYADYRAELRLAETSRFLDQFRSGPVADAWGRLRTAWRAEQDRQDALLARMSSLAGDDLARTLRDHQMFVLETIEEYRLQDDIEVVHQFLIRLAICVRMGSCDADVAAAQLGPALWTFRDQHRHYFDFEHSGVDLDGYLETIAPRPIAPGNPASPRW